MEPAGRMPRPAALSSSLAAMITGDNHGRGTGAGRGTSLAVAGGTLARDRQQGARRQVAETGDMEGRLPVAPSRCPSIPTMRSTTLRLGQTSPGKLSQGEYGARAGIPRIRRLLDRHGIRASFFVPAVVALLHPDEQRALADDGHEIGIHGWIHELQQPAAARGRARPAAARRRHPGEDQRRSAPWACGRRPGTSASRRFRSHARWACSTTPR